MKLTTFTALAIKSALSFSAQAAKEVDKEHPASYKESAL